MPREYAPIKMPKDETTEVNEMSRKVRDVFDLLAFYEQLFQMGVRSLVLSSISLTASDFSIPLGRDSDAVFLIQKPQSLNFITKFNYEIANLGEYFGGQKGV